MENEADIELIGAGNAPSSAAAAQFAQRFLASNGDINQFRSMSVLREDDWREFDSVVTNVARDRFSLVTDLMSRGLTRGLTNPLAVTQLSWDRVSEMNDAQVDMTVEAPDVKDRVLFAQDSMPLPIIHKGFSLNLRTLLASRRQGTGVDTLQVERATRKVVEKIESLFIGTSTYATGIAGSIYGLTTHPQRNTDSVTASWATATATQIVGDVLKMIKALEADNMYGPYGLYVPKAALQNMRNDYGTAGDIRTILQRVLEIPEIAYVKSNMFLTGNNVVMVNLTRDVIDVIDGFQPRLIEWQTQGDMVTEFRVMAMILPRIKRDYDNQSGIAHFS
jgi:uncharacterized linocin/CFP29 family protein